ncbi:MAG: hypothetical protein ABI199_08750 [Bacteroidia bacterium]
MKKIFFLFFIISCFLFSCNNSTQEKPNTTEKKDSSIYVQKLVTKKSVNPNNKKKWVYKDSIYTYEKDISNGEYSLSVRTTCLNDSVKPEETNIFNPVVLKQEMIFMKKNKIIYERKFPALEITQMVYNYKKVKMCENVIYEIGLISGLKIPFYTVYGYGGCNSCSEYFGYFTLDGKLLWEYYGVKGGWEGRGGKTYLKIGNDKTIKEFDIPDSLYPQHLKIVEVYNND